MRLHQNISEVVDAITTKYEELQKQHQTITRRFDDLTDQKSSLESKHLKLQKELTALGYSDSDKKRQQTLDDQESVSSQGEEDEQLQDL